MMANIVAATGSNEKMSAVSVGFRIFCAQIIMSMATNVARMPVINIAINNRLDQIIDCVSRISALKKDKMVTNNACMKKKGNIRMVFFIYLS